MNKIRHHYLVYYNAKKNDVAVSANNTEGFVAI